MSVHFQKAEPPYETPDASGSWRTVRDQIVVWLLALLAVAALVAVVVEWVHG